MTLWRTDALDLMPYMASVMFSLRLVDAPGLGTFAVDPGHRLYVDFDAVGADPQRWTPRLCVRAKVTTFLRSRPDLLHKMPTDPVTAGKGLPSPRSWTNAMAVLGELPAKDEDAALLVLTGCVGPGAATEYLAWAATASLYDPDAVLADPGIVDWRGSRPDQLFALVYSIAALVQIRPSSPKGWLAAIRVLEAAAARQRADVAAPAVKMLIRSKPKGVSVPDSLRDAFAPLFAHSGRWAA